MAILLPLYLTENHFPFYEDFAGSTFAALPFDSLKISAPIVVGLVYIMAGGTLAYAAYVMSTKIVIALSIEEGEESELDCPAECETTTNAVIASFSVEISGIPKNVTDHQMLRKHFEELYGEESVVSAHIALNLSGLINLENRKRKLVANLQSYQVDYQGNISFGLKHYRIRKETKAMGGNKKERCHRYNRRRNRKNRTTNGRMGGKGERFSSRIWTWICHL